MPKPLMHTFSSSILPIPVVKATKTKAPVFLVFSREFPNRISISSDGKWNPGSVYNYYDPKTESLIFSRECPEYAYLFDRELGLNGVYSPSALLAAGFLEKQAFRSVAEVLIKAQAVLEDDNFQLPPDLDYSELLKSQIWGIQNDVAIPLPGSTLEKLKPLKSAESEDQDSEHSEGQSNTLPGTQSQALVETETSQSEALDTTAETIPDQNPETENTDQPTDTTDTADSSVTA